MSPVDSFPHNFLWSYTGYQHRTLCHWQVNSIFLSLHNGGIQLPVTRGALERKWRHRSISRPRFYLVIHWFFRVLHLRNFSKRVCVDGLTGRLAFWGSKWRFWNFQPQNLCYLTLYPKSPYWSGTSRLPCILWKLTHTHLSGDWSKSIRKKWKFLGAIFTHQPSCRSHAIVNKFCTGASFPTVSKCTN